MADRKADPWTADDEQRLRAAVEAARSLAETARDLGRTVAACKLRASRLGLRWHRPRWTAEELRLLRTDATNHDIAARLGRSYASVRSQRKRERARAKGRRGE